MTRNKRTIHICTGGNLDVLPVVQENDMILGVDGGAIRILDQGIVPDMAIGDFDTIGEEGIWRLQQAGVKMEQYPSHKDLTDTEIAIEVAVALEPDEIILYGALGSRMDHTLANLQLLQKAQLAGVWMQIESKQNRVFLLSEQFPQVTISRDHFRFMSLLPMSEKVTGITLEGFMYPLHEATIEMGMAIGVSNEFLHETGTIALRQGKLFVMLTNDN